MENRGRPIPPDKVEDIYREADDERKMAASRVLMGGAYVLSSLVEDPSRDDVDFEVRVDWRADQVASTTLIAGLVHIGIQEFGESWQRALKTTLTPLLG